MFLVKPMPIDKDSAKTLLMTLPMYDIAEDSPLKVQWDNTKPPTEETSVELTRLIQLTSLTTDNYFLSVTELLRLIDDVEWLSKTLLPNLHVVSEEIDMEQEPALLAVRDAHNVRHVKPIQRLFEFHHSGNLAHLLERMETDFTFGSVNEFYDNTVVVLMEASLVEGYLTAFVPTRAGVSFVQSDCVGIPKQALTPVAPNMDDVILIPRETTEDDPIPFRVVSLSKALSPFGDVTATGLVFQGYQLDPGAIHQHMDEAANKAAQPDETGGLGVNLTGDLDDLGLDEEELILQSDEFRQFEAQIASEVEGNGVAFDITKDELVNTNTVQ